MRYRPVIGLMALSLFGAAAASAQEVCVVCSEPNLVYRCSVEKSDKLAALGKYAEKALQSVCIKELAHRGQHATCAVRQSPSAAVCDGRPTEISVASLLATPAEPAAAPPVVSPVAAAPPPKAPDPKDAPPRTVQELAERTGATSKQQLKNLGDNVGEAAAKTWGCLSSLFQKC